MNNQLKFIAYPAIEQHGLIGDRRTAGLVAADGTIDWLCLPNYDDAPVFGALLDAEKGGFWRVGPRRAAFGEQCYLDDKGLLVTRWELPEGVLELTDSMAWPEEFRGDDKLEVERVLLRRLRCTGGHVTVVFDFWPRYNFNSAARVWSVDDGLEFEVGGEPASLWSSAPIEPVEEGATGEWELKEGDEVWMVMALNAAEPAWTLGRAQQAMKDTEAYWGEWLNSVTYNGPQRRQVELSAFAVNMLRYLPSGSLVAAPTTSLPERIGGPRNYDYRYAWVRDASLSLAVLSMVGDTRSARKYLDWLTGLGSSTDAPLQVVYGIRGELELTERERTDIAGYRQSLPVRYGNHAYKQRQLDSLGYLADCALIYLQQGGEWKPAFWKLIRRAAEYTAQNWRMQDHGIWEMGIEAHFVSSKVMSWVCLDRALQIAERVGAEAPSERWRGEMEKIHAEVMERGWSETQQAFIQRYGSETLDASALLIPVMGFLPADHPRVHSTVGRIAAVLTIDGFVYRYHPLEEEGHPNVPLPEFEGAFLPCTFWLATTYSLMGRPGEAEVILAKADSIAGGVGLFAEEVDPRDKSFLGNYPLLFSQIEYVRAVLELAKARPLDRARLVVGELEKRVKHLFDGE